MSNILTFTPSSSKSRRASFASPPSNVTRAFDALTAALIRKLHREGNLHGEIVEAMIVLSGLEA
jgi:hypothetical protein